MRLFCCVFATFALYYLQEVLNVNIGERMKKRRKQLKLSADVVAERLGVSRSTIFRYEKGEIEKLPTNILDDIAKILQTTPAYLMGWESDNVSSIETIYNQLIPERQAKVYNFADRQLREQKYGTADAGKIVPLRRPQPKIVDIYGRLSAGGGAYNDKAVIETVEVDSAPSKYDMAFVVTGDSMYPTFEDGEVVFINETQDVCNGQIAAIEINNEAFIKKIYLEDKRMRMVSLNIETDKDGKRLYPDFYADECDNLFVIGRVIM